MISRLFSSKIAKQLPIEFICENNIIKDIKIFQELIGKDVREIHKYNKDKIYYISSNELEEIVKKELNKNIPLL